MQNEDIRISPISVAQIVAASGSVPTPVIYGWDGKILRPSDFRGPDGFGPNQPLSPAIDIPNYAPQEYQITPGFNLVPTPMTEPGTNAKLHPALKRAYADMCPYYRIAVGYRKNQVCSRKWAVVPREDSRSVKARKAFESQIKEATRFLEKPNRVDRLGITRWLEQLLEEMLVLDATVFHKQRHFDGTLSYVQTDGLTIKQIIDQWGHVVAFQQVLWGRPRTQYTAPVYEDFSVGEMAYWIFHPRVTNAYGTSAIEEILPIMETAIKRAEAHRGWYTEGTIPDAFLQAPAGWDAKAIAEYQRFWDNQLRDAGQKRKLRIIANGATYQAVKPFDFKKEEEDAIASILLAHMGVPKMILVSQVNRATAEAQQEDSADVGLEPLIAFLEEQLSEIVQEDLGFPDLKVICADGLAAQDEAEVDADVKLIGAKVLFPEEVREKRGIAPRETEDAGRAKGISAEYLTRAVFEAGVVTRDELRATLGLPPDPVNGGLYVTIGAFGATPPEELGAASAAAPAAPAPGAPAASPAPGAEPTKIPGGGKDAERDSIVTSALATLTGEPVAEPGVVKAERAAWRRFAVKRFEKRAHAAHFATLAISKADAHAIRIALHAARTEDAVRLALEKKAELTEAVKDKAASVVAAAARRMFEKEKAALLAAAKEKLPDVPADEAKGSAAEKAAKAWRRWKKDAAAEDAFEADVQGALKTVYRKAANDANVTGLDFDYLDANAAKYAKERGAELIGTGDNEWSVAQTTRDAANEMLQEALDKGWSAQKFADEMEKSGLFSDSRAETIARTEIGFAQNYGQCETYKGAGFVTVIVQDGDCDECQKYDGAEWPVERSLDEPLQHPNCVRSFYPGKLDDAD